MISIETGERTIDGITYTQIKNFNLLEKNSLPHEYTEHFPSLWQKGNIIQYRDQAESIIFFSRKKSSH